jgi:hypothetical protein
VAVYEQAAAAFQAAMALAASPGAPPSADRLADCRFALAETLQSWGEAALAECASLPDAQLSAAAEAAARSLAGRLFEQAVAHYRGVTEGGPGGSMRADASCNCGNTLAAWAEALVEAQGAAGAAGAAGALAAQAEGCYELALSKEEDAAVRVGRCAALMCIIATIEQPGLD